MNSALVQITAPATWPVSLVEAKQQSRVEENDDDDLITAYIQAATRYAEMYTRRAFITQTWEYKLDAFPGYFRIPKPPLASVTSITYVDTNGDTQTLAASSYRVDTSSEPGRIEAAYGTSWPSTRGVSNAVVVKFVCGYGAAADVPPDLRVAIRILAAHYYEMREPILTGTIVAKVPLQVESLLWGRRILEIR